MNILNALSICFMILELHVPKIIISTQLSIAFQINPSQEERVLTFHSPSNFMTPNRHVLLQKKNVS